MLKKIFKVFLIFLILAAIGLALAWMVLMKGYPWWAGVAVFLGLIGLWIGYIYIKKYFVRRKEKAFVQRIIAQDEEAIKKAPAAERKYLRDLQTNWKESIELLRGSYLRKKGNPLYVLPWYLVIGESGAGKTSAIKNTNLNSPIKEVSRSAGISVTKNCDWWFFEEAIILDTAGRYTIPIDESTDKEEWSEFLALLSKYRRREPVNGVIVTIAADKLLELDEMKLGDEGQSVRKRIDQLIRVLGSTFPIYILVTKLDLVQGMVEFSNLLPNREMEQAMGFINKRISVPWRTVLEDAMDSVSEQLKNLQMVMIHQKSVPEPEVFLFINEFERLQNGLELFIKSIFEENPYQETPPLRGMFFSSAIQEGRARPQSSQLFGLKKDEIQDMVSSNGLFLKDIFTKILPRDRYLFSPIREFLIWRRLTRNLGLLSWVLLWLCLCGLLSFSYFRNTTALEIVTEDNYKPPVLTDDLSKNLIVLDEFRSKIEKMESANRGWYVPRFGFNESLEVEARLKLSFQQLVQDSFLIPFDTQLIAKMEKSVKDTDEDVILEYIGYIEARISIIREALEGKSPLSIEKFRTISNFILMREDEELNPEVASLFAAVYHDYLIWNDDSIALKGQQAKYEAVLNTMLKNHEDLSWIIQNWMTNVPDVLLSDFWGDFCTAESDERIFVSGAYTIEGQKQIESFFSTIEAALTDATAFNQQKKRFWDRYQNQFYDKWMQFSRRFNDCRSSQFDINNWQQTANLMTTSENSYFRLLEMMAGEFEQFNPVKDEPPWITLIKELRAIRDQYTVEKEKANQSLVGELQTKKDQLFQGTLQKLDKQKAKELEQRQKAAKAWGEYLAALEQIAPGLATKETCFSMISDYYTYAKNTAESVSLLTNAEVKFLKFKNMAGKVSDSPYVWDMVQGPQEFILTYCGKEAAFVLQQHWEEEVLGGITGVDQKKIPEILFTENTGLVWKFIYGSGKPFITRSADGYEARKESNELLSLKSEFFEFLNSGPKSFVQYQPDYIVSLETLPIEANSRAKIKPYACILKIQGVEEVLQLENYNYPESQTFHWSPEKFSDVTLSVIFPGSSVYPEFTITKTYEGSLGFAGFLSDFQDGSQRYNAREFPQQEKQLKDIGISWIRISYKISGSKPVLSLLEKSPSRVPMEIASIWSM